MTIALTTPLSYDPGHGGATETLNEIKIIDFHVSIVEAWLTLVTQYGNTVEGVWIPGSAPGHDITIRNTPEILHPDDPEQSIPADPAYNILVGTSLTSAADVPVYSEVSDGLYQYLLDKAHYVGTIT
jgi:hypothetical protein